MPSSPGLRAAVLLATTSLLTAGLGATFAGEADGTPPPPSRAATAAKASVHLTPLGTHATGVFDQSAAEIPDFDPGTEQAFVVNAERGLVDVLDASDPSHPVETTTLGFAGRTASDGSTVPAGSQVNSLSVNRGLLAVAVESDPKTDRGWVALVRTRGLKVLSLTRVGVQPDMVTFTPDRARVVTANEAEPADDFSSDPAGSVSVIDVAEALRGRASASHIATFTRYDEGRALPARVRVYGPDVAVPSGQKPAGRVARNLEPEYVAVDRNSRTAYVTLQENNAVAVVDLPHSRVKRIFAMPDKQWDVGSNVLDASDEDGAISLAQWPVHALLEPDSIDAYSARGRTYVVTANEGDAREWGDYAETERVKDLDLCPGAFPDAEFLQRAENIGRLDVTTADGRTRAGCYRTLYTLGGRSMSILDSRGRLVFDSAGMIEQKIAELVRSSDLPQAAFNANNDDNDSFDTRSDNKGPEPEGVAIGTVAGRTYAFVGLERNSGIVTFNITDPHHVRLVDYAIHRDFSLDAEQASIDPQPGQADDLGPEGLHFVPGDRSPTGRAMLVVGNEVSGTTTFWDVSRGTAATRG